MIGLDPFRSKDLDKLSEIHHKLYYKMIRSKYEDAFPMIKGLSSLEMGILGVLADFPGASLKEICERLVLPKSTLTSAVNRLVNRDYVSRVVNEADRRSFNLVLTEAGSLAQHEHIAAEHTLYAKILTALGSGEDAARLIDLLEKIADDFS